MTGPLEAIVSGKTPSESAFHEVIKKKRTYLEPRLLTMKDVAVKDTRSGRRDRTINILCSSLHAFSHSPKERNRKHYQNPTA